MKKAVMRRVQYIYFVRCFTKPIAIEGMTLIAFAVVLLFSVSIHDVFTNIYHLPSISHCLPYIIGAFTKTGLIVQVDIVLATILGGFLVYIVYSRICEQII
ncbi:MAG: hypothetical protein WCW03_00165 [Candidatus Paceibacterota bacterium]